MVRGDFRAVVGVVWVAKKQNFFAIANSSRVEEQISLPYKLNRVSNREVDLGGHQSINRRKKDGGYRKRNKMAMEKLRQKRMAERNRQFGGVDEETADRVFDKEIAAGHISAKDVGEKLYT